MEAKTLYIKKMENGNVVPFPKTGTPAAIKSYTYSSKRMGGAPTITATLYYDRPLDKEWSREEFVEFLGEQYYISSIPSSNKDNTSIMYKHEISLVSRREILDNLLFFDVVSDYDEDTKGGDKYVSNQTDFKFGGNIKEFVSRINSALAYVGVYHPNNQEDKGYYVVIDEGLETDDIKEISFEDEYITNVLQLIKTKFEQNYYWVGKVCHVGNIQNDLSTSGEYGEKYVLKYGDALLSVGNTNSNNKIVDMITGKGSSENIPDYYPNDGRYGIAVFETENINKSDVSVNLSNLYKIGDPIGKEFYLCKSDKGTVSDSIDVSESDNINGTADEYGGDSGTLSVSVKFNAFIGTRIDLSNLKAISSYHNVVGNGLNASLRDSYSMVVNGVEQPLKRLDNNYICNENGEYELCYHCSYEVQAIGQTETAQSDYVTISVSLIGKISMGYDSAESVWFVSDGMYFNYDQSGIVLDNIQEAPAAKCTLVYDNGWKPSNVTGKEAAVKVSITGKSYVIPSGFLIPSIYRNSGGAMRFYMAENGKYEKPDGSGEYYSFKNLYKEDNPHQASVTFEDIKPTINGIRNDVIQQDGLGQLFGEIADVAFDGKDNDDLDADGNYLHPYFYIKLHKFSGKYGFSIFDHALVSDTAKINLTSSNGCPSCSFEIMSITSADGEKIYNCVSVDENGKLKKVNEDSLDYILPKDDAAKDTKNQDSRKTELWIALKKDDSTLGVIMPNAARGFKPKAGDKFVITGIEAPIELVLAAEKRLDDELIKYMYENNDDKFTLSVTFSRIYLQRNEEFASRLSENSRLTIEYDGKKRDVYVSNYSVRVDKDALAEVTLNLTESLDSTQGDMKNIVDAVSDSVERNLVRDNVSSSLTKAMAEKLFLSKSRNDSTPFKVAFGGVTSNGGMVVKGDAVISDFGTFASGQTGFGTRVNGAGAEMDSLTLRKFLEVPELRYNRVSVSVGHKWQAPGGGVIQSVKVSDKKDGGTCRLKLEDGEIGTIAVGDICMGIYHSQSATENSSVTADDNYGNFRFAGFYTAYWRITAVRNYTNEEGVVLVNGEFDYECRPISANYQNQHHPASSMNFVCYGSFTDKDRQQSRYSTLTYERFLSKVETWEIGSTNIRMQIGDLNSFKPIDGVDFTGYSLYCDSIYMSGYLKQLSDMGDPNPYTYSADTATDTFALLANGEPKTPLVEIGEGGKKSYLLHSSIQVRRGQALLVEAKNGDEATAGTYTLSAKYNGCDGFFDHSTLYVSDLEYESRNTATVEITIDCEGKGVLTLVYTIVIVRDGDKGDKGVDGAEHYQEVTYAISSKSTTSDSSIPPSDISSSAWKPTPVSTTTTKPYLWQKVMNVTKVGDDITASLPVYIRLTGEKGAQGERGEDGLDGHSWNMRGVAAAHVKSESQLPALFVPTGAVYLLDDSGNGEAGAAQRQGNTWLWITLTEGDSFLLGGDIMLLSNKKWVNLGSIKGDKGAQGEAGTNGRTTRIFQSLTEGQELYDGSIINADGFCFLDFYAVRNDSVASGWEIYQCIMHHIHKDSDKTPSEDTSRWRAVSVNASSAFFTMLLAKDARIDFLEGNSIRVRKSGQTTPYAGMGGDFPFWSGEVTDYPNADGTKKSAYTFAVDETGKLYAQSAYIEGTVKASSGSIGGFAITQSSLIGSTSHASITITPTSINTQSEYGEDGVMIVDTQSNITAAIGASQWGNTWTAALQLSAKSGDFATGTALDIITGSTRGHRSETVAIGGKVYLADGDGSDNIPRKSGGAPYSFSNGETVRVRPGAILLYTDGSTLVLPKNPQTGDSYILIPASSSGSVTIDGNGGKITHTGGSIRDEDGVASFNTGNHYMVFLVCFGSRYENGKWTGGRWIAKLI